MKKERVYISGPVTSIGLDEARRHPVQERRRRGHQGGRQPLRQSRTDQGQEGMNNGFYGLNELKRNYLFNKHFGDMEKEQEKKVKYGFGLSDTECFTDEFDTIDELIAFAQDAHDNPDGNYWDEDWDEDQYAHSIHVGVIERVCPMDFAPSLADIADQMTDKFYCEHNIDDDAEVSFQPRKEAEEAYKAFIEKYCDMPYQVVCNWLVGIYDLQEHKWIKRYDRKED